MQQNLREDQHDRTTRLVRDSETAFEKKKDKMQAGRTQNQPCGMAMTVRNHGCPCPGDLVVRMRMALATPQGCCLHASTLVLANRKLNVMRTPCSVVRHHFHVS